MPLLAALALSAPTAKAQVVNEDSARIAFTEGLRLRDKEHDPRQALEKLKAAHDLAVTIRTSYELGKTYMMLGSLVEAERMFLEVTRLPADSVQSAAGKDARDQSKQLADELEGRIPAVVVRLAGAPASRAEVYIDGTRVPDAARSLPWKANPGSHSVVVKVQGDPDQSRSVTLVEGKAESVDIDLTRAPEASSNGAVAVTAAPAPAGGAPVVAPVPPPSQGAPTAASGTWSSPRIAAVALGGAGGVAIAIGGALGLGAKSSFDNALKSQCGSAIGAPSSAQCSPDGVSARQSAGSRADAATAVMAIGGAAVAAGLVIWLVAKPDGDGSPRTGMSLRVSPGGVAVRGAF